MSSSAPVHGVGESLAAQALANLVNQFARPLDFLRELAQNAIDAGSPRIEFSVGHTPADPSGDGLLRIVVEDYGEGMDEDAIDNQLTRLFASSKERDLTKIGKFGIGFTSVFAIRPDAILVRTGRHGEYWELLFHPDRTFDKVRLRDPVHGTQIVLFKRMPTEEVDAFAQEVRFVLQYWCEHSETPILFRDETRSPRVAAPPAPDPFAMFAAPPLAAAERIDRPLALGAALEVHHGEPGLEIVIGFSDPPRYGFYNGGLTLLNTQSPEVLGAYARRLAHCTFKVKHDRLEHTLTRDNVLQDEHWERAMGAVLRAQEILRERLLEEIGRIAASTAPLAQWQRWLAADYRSVDPPSYPAPILHQPVFRDVYGAPVSLLAVRAEQARVGCVLVGQGAAPLYAALRREGHLVLEDGPEVRTLLEATEEPPAFDFLRRPCPVRRAEEMFVAPEILPEDALDPPERALVRRTEELLGFAVGLRVQVPGSARVYRWAPAREAWLNRLSLRVGDFGGTDLGRTEVLALNGPASGDVFLRPSPARFQLPAFVNWRTLLVNRHHPLFRAQLLASHEHLDLAAFGLASALLHVEGIEGEAAYRRMLAVVVDELDAR